jgi:hypothetical protein
VSNPSISRGALSKQPSELDPALLHLYLLRS